MNKKYKSLISFFSNRIFILAIIGVIMFIILIYRLFFLQIVKGESYLEDLSQSIAREIPIEAPRGGIYDRFGRPLATNSFAFSVKIDTSTTLTENELNLSLLNLLRLLDKNNESFIDTLPVTKEEPFAFTFYGERKEKQIERWKKDLGISKVNSDIDSCINALEKKYEIDKLSVPISNLEKRNLISIRSNLFLTRFKKYNPTTLSTDVGLNTVTKLEEQPEDFKSIYIDTESLRKYPDGKYFSHIIGYIGSITDNDDKKSLISQGYKNTDLIGKTGLERSFEKNLKGIDGKKVVVVNNIGKRIGELTANRVEPVQGDKVFTSIDKELQIKTYNILENKLKEILKANLNGKSTAKNPVTIEKLLASLVQSNNISAKKVFDSSPNTVSYKIKNYVLSIDNNANIKSLDARIAVNKIIAEGIRKKDIAPSQILLLMYEQGIITGDDNFVSKLQSGTISARQVILNKIDENEITPQMTNIDPSTGSIIVVDVHSGEVITSVSYPSYDNNKLVNNFDNEYYIDLMLDATKPLTNRPFNELRPPGSTFKMITGIAGLETGAINLNTKINDGVIFTKTGTPYPKCHSSHGVVDIVKALEVSCNYFFYETSYRLGNTKAGTKFNSINTLNKYMEAFGFNERTGVEIGEAYDKSNLKNNISSPEFKKYKFKNSDISSAWTDGDTVRTAIGQSLNNYTPANMVKYISAIATKGTMYNLHFLRKIVSPTTETDYEIKPTDTNIMNISSSTWNAIHKGMFSVTHGSRGTARAAFSTFSIDVAGKTGTAQENLKRNNHSSFGAFAPYNDPQIAVYILLPYAESTAATTSIVRDVIAEYFKLNQEPELPVKTNSIIK